jgi:hypothetical protein
MEMEVKHPSPLKYSFAAANMLRSGTYPHIFALFLSFLGFGAKDLGLLDQEEVCHEQRKRLC